MIEIKTKDELLRHCTSVWLEVLVMADNLAGGWGLGDDDEIVACITLYDATHDGAIRKISKAMNDNGMVAANPWTPFLHAIEARRHKDGLQTISEDTTTVT